ncbi:MAG TPA: Na+/H+ antiporter NhaA [Gammaproteobacteria bacterium]|jgi:NhaA family Na+:H+ antiporter|nr:Na+/H+ antiporter NhaA [Gammaproteobacteria bacterium]
MKRLWQQFLQLETASGIVLFSMAVLAFIWSNSPLAPAYQWFVNYSLFGINDGLMTIFFLLVGLELKRGFLDGELNKPAQIALPAVAALGGMLVPALLYLAINYPNPITMKAWATPVATDIAFAVGVLALFGRRIPKGLKLFLLALAIFDDLGAIIIIGVFYSHGLSWLGLLIAAGLVGILYGLNRQQVDSLLPYLLIGLGLWGCFLYSGIHPTLAGVLLAFAVPRRLEHYLHPWVAFGIMPLFALANAGFSINSFSWMMLTDSVILGIIAGLFIGKQIGVMGFVWAITRLRLAVLPAKSSWWMVYGVALLCGIGFTMSLFLGTLSFADENAYLIKVRIGVIIGSILSGLVGAIVLQLATRSQKTRVMI